MKSKEDEIREAVQEVLERNFPLHNYDDSRRVWAEIVEALRECVPGFNTNANWLMQNAFGRFNYEVPNNTVQQDCGGYREEEGPSHTV
jgi:hypothetical protein